MERNLFIAASFRILLIGFFRRWRMEEAVEHKVGGIQSGRWPYLRKSGWWSRSWPVRVGYGVDWAYGDLDIRIHHTDTTGVQQRVAQTYFPTAQIGRDFVEDATPESGGVVAYQANCLGIEGPFEPSRLGGPEDIIRTALPNLQRCLAGK